MKKIITLFLVLCIALSMTACGPTGGGGGLKPEITINVYNGGNGTKWIEDMAEVYNEINADNTEYEIVIFPEQTGTADIISNILDNRVGNIDAYYVSETNYKQLIHKDKLEDLSDILTMKVDGTDVTIGDKIGANGGERAEYFASWKKYAGKEGEGMYMLPYGDSYIGYVFDYGTFVEKGWLFKAENDSATRTALTNQGFVFEVDGLTDELIFRSYNGSENINYIDGDIIQKAGKDGKFGTYDDGQPVTMTEWNTMISKIKGTANSVPFIWASKVHGYTDAIVTSIIAQYSGYNAYQSIYSFNSNGQTITLNDGSQVVITPENGYQAYSIDGFEKAVEFLNANMTGANVHAKTRQSDLFEHKGPDSAQEKFLYGFLGNSDNPQSAMLVEGAWWENEARTTFNALEYNNYKDRAYGKRDYRYMLLPEFEGQQGIDGQGNGSFFSVQSSGAIIIPKMNNSTKLQELKDFIAYTLSNENLRKFTRDTGVIQPFDYELTASDRSVMTPFARTNWDIYHDTENIKLIRPLADFNAAPMKFALPSSAGFASLYLLPVSINNQESCAIYGLLKRNMSVSEVVDAMANYYTSTKWSQLLNLAKVEGFYA